MLVFFFLLGLFELYDECTKVMMKMKNRRNGEDEEKLSVCLVHFWIELILTE